MKVFHCDHCQQLVFFENVQCVRCKHALAYFPDLGFVGSLDEAGPGLWQSPLRCAQGRVYRLCENYARENICNWAVADDDPHPLCVSCRLTVPTPNLLAAPNRSAWYRLELAKRRLVYTLQKLGLPLQNRIDDPHQGLAFEFLGDAVLGSDASILTGHMNGVITINIAEADDAVREKHRLELHEPYRTLLGHFRHEIGHYYWDRLVQESTWLDAFRSQFGDERQDYAESLARHYQQGPPPDWQDRFVSAYASSHPWEDWAETWAHFLHITDTLETASACGLVLQPRRVDEPTIPANTPAHFEAFDTMIENWFALTYVLNNLNRGLGLPDGYPFVLSTPAIEKLRLIQEIANSANNRPS